MTAPRSLIVDPAAPGFYHCVSRCVRRAFLCGLDHLTGRDCSHRKLWVEDRLRELAELFALNIYAYAVMSNHLHVVVQLDPETALAWPSDEVASRWVRLFPVKVAGELDSEANAQRHANLLAQPERLGECRARLASLSWFMRCLSEPIARRANGEDHCTGRFWEGRYKCHALLDERALLACMTLTYVDLNPIRAGIADDLRASDHTSVGQRLTTAAAELAARLQSVAGCVPPALLSLTLRDYLDLVDWTGRVANAGKRGLIPPGAPPVLAQLELDVAAWRRDALGIRGYARAVGSAQALKAKARAIGQMWLRGYRVPAPA